MALKPGTMLGPYEILSLIGAGGMGEVYKARDTRLERIVALKVLPAPLAERGDLRERFEREARAIANLQHPNICVLYDIGEQNGIHFLVMEYLDGETVAHRLVKGPLPLEQVLRYACEITDALDKAHRQGFTHRDIKPGNIMLTKAGSKILDFGLAKLKQEAAQPNLPQSQIPTAPSGLTADGQILGTLQYMAPEQVEGKIDDIDGRADIFAFGAVVYEMLTGKKAFEGNTQASVIAAILKDDPPPMSSLQPMTPPALDRVVKRCLVKERDERWQSAADLWQELEWLKAGGSQAGIPAPLAARRKFRERVAWASAAVIVLITGLALGALYFSPRPAPPEVVRFAVSTPGNSPLFVSPDGRQVAFIEPDSSGKSVLWIRALDSLAARVLPGTEGAVDPFWSPDSRSLGFFADSKLKKVEVSSGSVQALASTLSRYGGAWNRDGVIVFSPQVGGGLARVSEAGGEVSPVTTPDSSRREIRHRWPQFLPDSDHFIYLVQSAQPENTGIYLASLGSKETRWLVRTDSRGSYASPGYLLFVREATLMAQPFDAERLGMTGEPVLVAEDVYAATGFGSASFSVSDTGVLAYANPLGNNLQFGWFDRGGNPLGTIGPPADYAGQPSPELSPDEKQLAATRGPSGREDIWLFDLGDRSSSRFTFDGARENSPVWSPDGSRVLFRSTRGGGIYNLYQKSSTGAGNEELVFQSDDSKYPNDWSSDGRFLLYTVPGKTTGSDLWVLPLSGDPGSAGAGRKPFLFLQTPANEGQGQFSPDGRWVAYTSNESGKYEVYVQSFPTPGSKRQVSTGGGVYPRWRGDGKELFYTAADGKLMAVEVTGGARLEFGVPKALFQTIFTGLGRGGTQHYAVTGDGQRFLVNVPVEDSDAAPITVVLNWTAGLKK